MKHRMICTVIAVLLIGCFAALLSGCFEWNPVSSEEKEAAVAEYDDMQIYWTKQGQKYHLYEDCPHLDRNGEIITGTVEQALESGKEAVCKTCDQKYQEQLDTNP